MKKILALSGLAVLACNALALTQLTSRAQIPVQSNVDWSTLGADMSLHADPSLVVTGGQPFNVQIDGPGNNMQVRKEGSSWYGNFAAGDNLLFTNFVDGTVRLNFSKTVSDFGTQIQRNHSGAATITITAFDGLDTNLGSYNVAATWGYGTEDNTAAFVGVHSSASDIAYVTLFVTPANTGYEFDQGWAMNQLSLACCNTNPVPEPFTMGVLGLGSIVALRRKAKKA
ncbi:MAG: PEP-CTERM sorting domain-containing protein [Armatimonadetes bacterium]|nr:PEP-CTERM sorting domain-containing protein [Armatimonadota bacterium]